MKSLSASFSQSLADLLDVRETVAAAQKPIRGAVNIPMSELADSVGELPPRDKPVRVADTGPEATRAVQLLCSIERQAELDEIFAHGENPSPLRLWQPNSFLIEVIPNLAKGNALDLACGAGREAVTLASLGWEVTATDHLPDALERAERLARRFGIAGRVEWRQADLGKWQPPEADLAIMFFFLDRDLIQRTVQALKPGGSLILETFTPTHRERFGKPRHLEYVIAPEEAERSIRGLEIVHVSEGWRESGRHTVRLWARSG